MHSGPLKRFPKRFSTCGHTFKVVLCIACCVIGGGVVMVMLSDGVGELAMMLATGGGVGVRICCLPWPFDH